MLIMRYIGKSTDHVMTAVSIQLRVVKKILDASSWAWASHHRPVVVQGTEIKLKRSKISLSLIR